MTIYLIILFVFAGIIVRFLLENQKKNKNNFDAKQHELEKIITNENNRLAKQKQKLEIVDDFKKMIKINNEELSAKIVDINNSLFEELFDKSKNRF